MADSSQYCLLRSETRRTTTTTTTSSRTRRAESFRVGKRGVPVPEGHLPVFVGEEMERFIVSAELLNHPIFVTLLNKSAQEYGYEQKGVLRIPCHVFLFERVLEAVRLGDNHSNDLEDLLNSLSDG